jgi:CHAT domain-containing protein
MYRNATNNKTIQFNYLQGTKTEVETVAANAKNTNWKVQTYTNTNASEDNFKNLSGENAPKILHIATHGFYFPPTKTKPTNFITEDKNTPKDFPLLRSGLVLSGVNNYWGKDTLLENKEDGIVTAQEISTLNLLNTDLVVLSACQTALGDINGSEGVYGLQRAFKMAGVKKLLMSLWEVPDAETAELMQLFYSNVFKGETYYTAFRKAQLALKAKYKDPTKWAGFVLVGE